jgi:hypothetical protein
MMDKEIIKQQLDSQIVESRSKLEAWKVEHIEAGTYDEFKQGLYNLGLNVYNLLGKTE